MATIKQLGGKPVAAPGVDFGKAFANEESFLELAQTFEDTGVSAYNGAAPEIESTEVLAAAGSIVQVEARHAAAIRLLRGENPAPMGFDDHPHDGRGPRSRQAVRQGLAGQRPS